MAAGSRSIWKNVVFSLIGALALLVVVAVLLPVWLAARPPTKRSECLSRMKETALAVLMYAADFDDRFPPAPVWADSVSPYSKSYLPDHDVFRCPDLDELGPGRYGHAFYARLGLQSSQELADPMNTPMLFDSTDLSWSAYGDLSLLPAQGRHPNGTNVVAFADGHAHATTVPALFDAMRSKSR